MCGKLVVAATRRELLELDRLLANSHHNGLTDVEMLDQRTSAGCERSSLTAPESMHSGSHTPASSITPRWLQQHTAGLLDIGETAIGLHLSTTTGAIRARRMITSAGLQADRVARRATGDGRRATGDMVAFQGGFFQLAPSVRHLVRNLIYPVPDPSMPFLGVHMTRTTGGQIECGPNAVPTFKREGYGKSDFNLRDTVEAFGYRGTWRLMRKHLAFGLDEYRMVISKRAFLGHARRLIPALQVDDLIPTRAGVRAVAIGRSGTILDDFRVLTRSRAIHVLNAPSSAATACLAIGRSGGASGC